MQPSLDFVLEYLDGAEPYDYINLMLFNHGVDAVGLPSVEEWRTVLGRARLKGSFVGLDEERFPRDFASLINYYTDLKALPARYPLPGPLTLSQLDEFLAEKGDTYDVQWLDGEEEQQQAAD